MVIKRKTKIKIGLVYIGLNQGLSFLFIFFGVLAILFLIFPKIVNAATYNPYNVISNSVFTNKNSMTASQIESFLQSHGSVFANYIIPEYISVPYPYRDAKGNPAWATVSVRQINAGNPGTGDTTAQLWGVRVSTLIYREAQEHGINPQLIIVMIQKESSAITQNSIGNATKAWMLGYGYNETMASYGYNETTARNRALAYGGVGQQIARATMWLRLYYSSALQGPIGATCDGVSMNAANAASQVLYLYTPHSQYNVWRLMQDWFNGGNPYNFGPIPNTDLIKYGSYYYLIYNGKRYNLGSTNQMVKNYGYTTTSADVVTAGEFSAFVSAGNLSNYIKSSAGKEYLVAGGLKYKIWPSTAFKERWNLNLKKPVLVASELLNAIPNSPKDLTGLIRADSSSTYYFIDTGRRYKVWPSSSFWRRWGFYPEDVVVLPADFVATLPYTGRYLTCLVRGKTLPMVYLIDEGRGKPIMSMGIFYHWGWHDSDIIWLSDSFIRSLPKKSFITRLMWIGPQIYWVNNAQFYRIGNAATISNRGWSWGDIGGLSNELSNALPVVGTIW